MSLERRVLTGSPEEIISEFNRKSLPYSELIFSSKDNSAEMITQIDLSTTIEEETSQAAQNVSKKLNSAGKFVKEAFTLLPVVKTFRRAPQH